MGRRSLVSREGCGWGGSKAKPSASGACSRLEENEPSEGSSSRRRRAFFPSARTGPLFASSAGSRGSEWVQARIRGVVTAPDGSSRASAGFRPRRRARSVTRRWRCGVNSPDGNRAVASVYAAPSRSFAGASAPMSRDRSFRDAQARDHARAQRTRARCAYLKTEARDA